MPVFNDLAALPSGNDTDGGYSGQAGEISDFEFNNSRAMDCEKTANRFGGFEAMNLHLVAIPRKHSLFSKWYVIMRQVNEALHPS